MNEALKTKDTECRQRIGRIFKEIKDRLSEEYQKCRNTPANVNLLQVLFDYLQSLKDKELKQEGRGG